MLMQNNLRSSTSMLALEDAEKGAWLQAISTSTPIALVLKTETAKLSLPHAAMSAATTSTLPSSSPSAWSSTFCPPDRFRN